jgi:hypothetical protein
VADNTLNYFKTSWQGGEFPLASDNCDYISGCTVFNDACICDTDVVEEAVFTSTPPSRNEILASLRIGAFHPDMFDGIYTVRDCGVTVYLKSGGDCSNLDEEAIFFVEDDNGVGRYLKNMHSTVRVVGTSFSFRNPVHFISLVDPEVRDAYYETDAVLDHYFYHPNHPPFLATRIIQRFGISNPSPRFVESVAEAYKSGSFQGAGRNFGSSSYGDLGAMVGLYVVSRPPVGYFPYPFRVGFLILFSFNPRLRPFCWTLRPGPSLLIPTLPTAH